jgi:fructose-bisphosphate aldolase class II
MPLSGSDLLIAARAAGVGVGAFNVIQIEHAEALVAAAEQVALPVILQISENAAGYHGALAPIALATREIAGAATVPVVLHLDHAMDETLVDEAIALGFTSVMFDGAHLPWDENVARTAAVVQRAHDAGVWVEAELGEVGGKDGAHAPGVLTRADEAAAFVAATGVDALAVAVGSSHAMTERTAALNLERIAEIAATVRVPLVLHGSSGVPDDALVAAVRAGMRKVNIATHLNTVFTGAVREYLAAHPDVVDTRKYVGAGREAGAVEAARLLELLALRGP